MYTLDNDSLMIRLMVQKSYDHQLRLVVYPIIYLRGFIHPRWCRSFSISCSESYTAIAYSYWILFQLVAICFRATCAACAMVFCLSTGTNWC